MSVLVDARGLRSGVDGDLDCNCWFRRPCERTAKGEGVGVVSLCASSDVRADMRGERLGLSAIVAVRGMEEGLMMVVVVVIRCKPVVVFGAPHRTRAGF